jgi:hypothetical protein
VDVGAWEYWITEDTVRVQPAQSADDSDELLCQAKRLGMSDPITSGCDGSEVSKTYCSQDAFKALCPFTCAKCATPTLQPHNNGNTANQTVGHRRECQSGSEVAAAFASADNFDAYLSLATSRWHCNDFKVFTVMGVVTSAIAVLIYIRRVFVTEDSDGSKTLFYASALVWTFAGLWFFIVWVSVIRLVKRGARCDAGFNIGGNYGEEPFPVSALATAGNATLSGDTFPYLYTPTDTFAADEDYNLNLHCKGLFSEMWP